MSTHLLRTVWLVRPRASFRQGSPNGKVYRFRHRSKELIGTTDNFVREMLLERETYLKSGALALDAGNGNASAMVADNFL